jgi:hypothetical protein
MFPLPLRERIKVRGRMIFAVYNHPSSSPSPSEGRRDLKIFIDGKNP